MAVFSTLRTKQLNKEFDKLSASYLRHRPLVQRVLNISFVLYVLGTTLRGLSSRPAKPSSAVSKKGKGKGKDDSSDKPRVAVSLPYNTFHFISQPSQVDALFYQRLARILRIVIPGIKSKEALLLLMHSSLLILRTAISLYVAALDGKCVAFPCGSRVSLMHMISTGS